MGGGAGAAEQSLVDAAEDVCRLCFSSALPLFRDAQHPNQIDPETGMLRLSEISWKDVSESGFSLQRRKLYNLADGLEEAKRRDEAKSQKLGASVAYKLAGILLAKVERITLIADPQGAAVFRVLATPTADSPAHAEVRIDARIIKQDFLQYRVALQQALGRVQDPELLDAQV